jgi:hypothetical protein
MVLSGSVSNNQITAIFYQADHRDIQKDINLALWNWYFRERFLERSDMYQECGRWVINAHPGSVAS